MRRVQILVPMLAIGFAHFVAAAQEAPGGGSGTLVVLNKAEASASLLDLASGKEVARIETGNGPHEAVVSADGRTVVIANYGTGASPGHTLTVIDLPTMSVRATIDLQPYHRPHGLAFLPDGRLLVTAEAEQHLLIVNVASGEVEAAIETGQNVSHMVAATPDGLRAFVSNIGSGSVTAIDLAANEVIRSIATGSGAEGVAVSPDGNEVWVSNRASDTVTVLNTSTLEVVATLASAAFPIRVKFTPDGSHALVSNARSGDVAVFDTRTREEVRRIAMGGDDETRGPMPVGILIPPDGTRAYIANTSADFVTVIDLTTWEVVGRLRAGREPDGMAWSPLSLAGAEEPMVVEP